MTDTATKRQALPPIAFRPAAEEDLGACAAIWRVAINDYISRLAQPEIPDDLAAITRLYAHLHGTDPSRFLVATSADRIVAYAVAVVRERVWFLSMLFVLPEVQARGLGRELLRRVLPAETDGLVRATGTDTAQPISNALYASLGIVPRVPVFNLTGLPERPAAFGALPSGVAAVPFDEIAASAGGAGHAELATTIDGLDREVNGFAHPHDHRYLRQESRRGWLYRGPDGVPLGYGYAAESGRLGPVCMRDAALLGPVLGHLTGAVEPRGAFSTWIPGLADRALVPALQAGFRLEPFPVLLCWDEAPADFARYLPISPGLL